MPPTPRTTILIRFLLLVGLAVGLSFVSSRIWGGKPERRPEARDLTVRAGMTVAEFGEANGVPDKVLRKVFGLKSKADLARTLDDFAISLDAVTARTKKAMALRAEHGAKNWVKILVKFALWLAFLGMVFVLMRRRRVTPGLRSGLLAAAVVIFGVGLGPDPNPMGTVKDAIALLGAEGVIFPPRMIALAVFLVMVVLANKFICTWGCQFGALQDLAFRLNRDSRDRKGVLPQVKLPFAVSNSIRIAFFLAFTAVALSWAYDIIEPIDPFKIYRPTAIIVGGGAFLALLLSASLFVYRPWCTLFCPFGLVGWLAEKISWFKIRVDYDACIACGACTKACPTTVMAAILKQDKAIPDCFACGTCIGACPSNAISLAAGERTKPPADKFVAMDED